MTDLQDALENVKLLRGLVDADGSSSNLTAVQHQVVVLTTYLDGTRVIIIKREQVETTLRQERLYVRTF